MNPEAKRDRVLEELQRDSSALEEAIGDAPCRGRTQGPERQADEAVCGMEEEEEARATGEEPMSMIDAAVARELAAEYKADHAKRTEAYLVNILPELDRRIRQAAGGHGDCALIDEKVQADAAGAVAEVLRDKGFKVYIDRATDGAEFGVVYMDISWLLEEEGKQS